MASGALQNATNQSRSAESKKKKKVASKNLETPIVDASKDSSALNSPQNGPQEPSEGSGEKEHIRETLKHIRNVNKKLNLMTKVDAIIKENPGVSLDELVASRKINNDQKAQAQKKPQLQSQLQSLEEQLSAYRKIDTEYRNLIDKEKESLLASHVEELNSVRDEVRNDVEKKAKEELKINLLTFSRFLAAAANRRNTGDEESPEARAFEGALLLVYGGDANAVEAAEKIISGSEENVIGVDGASTGITFAKVRELTLIEIPVASDHPQTTSLESDPTIANAGLTELEDPTTTELINGTSKIAIEEEIAPPATSIDADASNATGASWDPTKTQEDLERSYEIVPRTNTESTVAPSEPMKESWADIPQDSPPAETAANGKAPSSDGFEEVKHHHGGRGPRGHHGGQRGGGDRGSRGGRGRGGFRGDYRGDSRGRGPRGGFRGRGRGD